MSDPAAEEFEIGLGGARATIGSVGGSLLNLEIGGRRYAHSHDLRTPWRPVPGAGKVMVPWPNRTAGGRWTFEGQPRQLEITEPERGNAIHGLVSDAPWKVAEQSRSQLTLETTIDASPGWPVPLRTTVRYEVGGWGLRVTHGVHNLGDRTVPFGLGAHPYLVPGEAKLSDCEIKLQASKVMPYDAETMLPTGRLQHVQHTPYDFRRGKLLCLVLQDMDLDNTFGRCRARPDGAIRHSVTGVQGGVELWTDNAFRWVHAFQWLPEDPPGHAVAIEPMTCPPNALNTGVDLINLPAGKSWHANWGIRPLNVPRLR